MRELMKGNEAVIHAAVAAGCRAYFGYPITPASEIAEAASLFSPRRAGFSYRLKVKSARSRWSSGRLLLASAPCRPPPGRGISLMQEGLSVSSPAPSSPA